MRVWTCLIYLLANVGLFQLPSQSILVKGSTVHPSRLKGGEETETQITVMLTTLKGFILKDQAEDLRPQMIRHVRSHPKSLVPFLAQVRTAMISLFLMTTVKKILK